MALDTGEGGDPEGDADGHAWNLAAKGGGAENQNTT